MVTINSCKSAIYGAAVGLATRGGTKLHKNLQRCLAQLVRQGAGGGSLWSNWASTSLR